MFGALKSKPLDTKLANSEDVEEADRFLLEALQASNLSVDELLIIYRRENKEDTDALSHLMLWLANATAKGWVSLYPDGRYGPKL